MSRIMHNLVIANLLYPRFSGVCWARDQTMPESFSAPPNKKERPGNVAAVIVSHFTSSFIRSSSSNILDSHKFTSRIEDLGLDFSQELRYFFLRPIHVPMLELQ